MGRSSIIEELYNCNSPTRKKAHLFLFLGNSMVNGYSSDYSTLLTVDQDKYIAVADMTEYSFASRTSNPFRYLKRADFTADSRKHGNYASAMIDLYNSGAFADGDLFAYQYAPNGIGIINGDTNPSWSVDDSDGSYYAARTEIDWIIRYLTFAGYDVVIRGVNLSVGGGVTSEVEAEYKAEYENFMSAIRTHYANYGGSSIPFVIGIVPSVYWGNPGIACRAAILSIVDSLMTTFDTGLFPPQATDTWHQRSQGVLGFGQFVASYFVKVKTGNNFPVASSVHVSGLLIVGQSVTATYSYNDSDGDAEGDTRITITYANDVIGTAETLLGQHFKGGSTLLSPATAGKYLRARVEPVALTGASVGIAVLSPWSVMVIS